VSSVIVDYTLKMCF